MDYERLPKSVMPINYNLTINPDLAGSNFTGDILIKIKVSLHN